MTNRITGDRPVIAVIKDPGEADAFNAYIIMSGFKPIAKSYCKAIDDCFNLLDGAVFRHACIGFMNDMFQSWTIEQIDRYYILLEADTSKIEHSYVHCTD